MNYNIVLYATAALSAVLTFSSCEKIAINEESEFPSTVTDQVNGSARLNIITRTGAGDSDDDIISEGRIYLFNSAGKCIQLLSTDEENNQATVQLSAGSYALYAVGGNDLSRFSFPIQSEATSASVIKLIDGKVMDDLLMASANVDLEDGETLNQNLSLVHKVLCIDEIEIKQLPQTVTKVEVSLAPLYSSVQLDGEYPASPTGNYKIELTKQSDGTTWKASPKQMLFPSKGNPTIKVSITTDEGVMGYSYNAAEELPANHHFTIIGTYKAEQGVSLTGVLTAAGWEEDRTISFDLDGSNQTVYNPVAREFCNGYYVVTVDEVNRKAVLLSRTNVSYVAPTGSYSQNAWIQAFVAPLEALDKPEGANCGNWRLPTINEAKLITQDPRAVTIDTSESPYISIDIFCLDEGVLKWIESSTEDFNTYTYRSSSDYITSSANIYLRPVIDISY